MIKYTINNCNIFIPKIILSVLNSFKQTDPKSNESGGIILGQIKDNDIYVMSLSYPNKFDKSSKNKFVRDAGIARIIMHNEFLNSNRKTIYIGEWHTHMEEYPTPSYVDINMIKTEFKQNDLNEPYLLLIIQGTKELYVGMYDGGKLTKYSSISDCEY